MKIPIPRGRRAILILGIPVGLAAAGGLAFTMLGSGPKAPPAVPDPATGQLGPMLALDSRVVNLTPGTTITYKYAKVSVTVEIRPSTASFYELHGTERTKSEATELADYTAEVPVLDDAVGQVVAAHTPDSLSTADGVAQLKTELLGAMRKILGDQVVIAVYLTDFVMQ